MTKVYLKSHEKAQAIPDFLKEHPQSSAKQISTGLQLGLSTVYNTLDDLGDLLDKKSIGTSHQHRATVFSVSKSDTRKVVMSKADGKSNAPKPHPLMQHLYGQIA